jgi:hypothetical protein
MMDDVTVIALTLRREKSRTQSRSSRQLAARGSSGRALSVFMSLRFVYLGVLRILRDGSNERDRSYTVQFDGARAPASATCSALSGHFGPALGPLPSKSRCLRSLGLVRNNLGWGFEVAATRQALTKGEAW